MTFELSRIPRSTPLGRRAGLIGLGLMVAGFNTGNNLFYLFFTLLAATELVGFLAAGRVLKRAAIEIVPPRRARSGEPMRVTVRLSNLSRWLPLPTLDWRLHTDRADMARGTSPGVSPLGRTTATLRVVPPRRGWLNVEHLEVRTDFPLGLSQRVARLRPPSTRTLVLPAAESARADRAGTRRGEPRGEAQQRTSGEEPVDAREYRAGDDARRIDWKASARTQRLIWREGRGLPPRIEEIRLDRSGPPGPTFERRVSRAAGAAADALARGQPLAFRSDDWQVPPRPGRGQYRRILDYLALVEAVGDRRAP